MLLKHLIIYLNIGLLLLDEHLLLGLLGLLGRDGDLGVLLLFATVEGQRTLDEEVPQTLGVLGVQKIQLLLLGQEQAVLQSLEDLVVLSVQELVVDGMDLVGEVGGQEMQVLAPVVRKARALVDVCVAVLVELLVGFLLIGW